MNKSMVPSVEIMTDNLVQLYGERTLEQENEGRGWYATSTRFAKRLARKYNVTQTLAAGVIAILSPRNTWAKNQEYAIKVFENLVTGQLELDELVVRHEGGLPQAFSARYGVGGLPHNAYKALRLALTQDFGLVTGDKVKAFWQNISGDLTGVTVDVWAIRAALARFDLTRNEMSGLTGKLYVRIADAYKAAAAIVDEEPAVFQAICWCVCRGHGH